VVRILKYDFFFVFFGRIKLKGDNFLSGKINGINVYKEKFALHNLYIYEVFICN